MPRELLDHVECVGEDFKFEALTVTYKENGQIYIAHHPVNVLDMSTNSGALESLQGDLIPREHIYPKWREGLMQAPVSALSTCFVKPPNFRTYNGNGVLADILLAEIELMEILSRNPHPNICKYYGCTLEGESIVGMCFKKYKCTLYDLVKEKTPSKQEREKLLKGLKSGLEHLHSLGLVHDDINPRNIMVDNEGNVVIIDFGSCEQVGENSYGGTPGWSLGPKKVLFENDDFGLSLVEKFMEGGFDGIDPEIYFKN